MCKKKRYLYISVVGLLFTVCCVGYLQQISLEKKLAVTKIFVVDELAEHARTLPKEDMLVTVSERLSTAFDDIKKTKNSLKKPYLVAVILRHYVPNEYINREESLFIHIEWFENRFIPHSIQFTNIDTMESWTYNFQSTYSNRVNTEHLGVRFYQTYRFGGQAPGIKFVTFEEGVRLAEMAQEGKLKSALVNEEGAILSNEVLVDFHKRHLSVDDLPATNEKKEALFRFRVGGYECLHQRAESCFTGVSNLLWTFPAVFPLVGVEDSRTKGDFVCPLHPPTRSRLLQPSPHQVLTRPLNQTTLYRPTLRQSLAIIQTTCITAKIIQQ